VDGWVSAVLLIWIYGLVELFARQEPPLSPQDSQDPDRLSIDGEDHAEYVRPLAEQPLSQLDGASSAFGCQARRRPEVFNDLAGGAEAG